jgi:hypothetical protein
MTHIDKSYRRLQSCDQYVASRAVQVRGEGYRAVHLSCRVDKHSNLGDYTRSTHLSVIQEPELNGHALKVG